MLRANPEIMGPPERKKAAFVSHIHDEAQMKMRSVVFADESWVPNTKTKAMTAGCKRNPHPYRCRLSKIQQNVVQLCVGNDRLEMFTELQPLRSKTGPTIATAITEALYPFFQVARRVAGGAGQDKGTMKVIH